MEKDFLAESLSLEERLFRVASAAEDRVSRLDERIKASGFAQGWRDRSDLRAVIAHMWSGGELIHPEDLLLHSLGADTRVPDQALLRANALLRARQKAWRGGEELLSWRGVSWLAGRSSVQLPSGVRPTLVVGASRLTTGSLTEMSDFLDQLGRGQSETPRAAVEECLEVLDVTAPAPALLAAAALMEAWRLVDPLPSSHGVGGVLAALVLRTRGRFTAGLFPIEAALRRHPMPPRLVWAPPLQRLQFWVETLHRSAQLEIEELSRLSTQKVLIERRARGGRRNSRAPALAALAVDRAFLTSELVARELGLTPQGAGLLLKRFDGVLNEITGRASYRVWRL